MRFNSYLSNLYKELNAPMTAPKWPGWIAVIKWLAYALLFGVPGYLLVHSRLSPSALLGVGCLLAIAIIVDHLRRRIQGNIPATPPQSLPDMEKELTSYSFSLLITTYSLVMIPIYLYAHRPVELDERFLLLAYPSFVVGYVIGLMNFVELLRLKRRRRC